MKKILLIICILLVVVVAVPVMAMDTSEVAAASPALYADNGQGLIGQHVAAVLTMLEEEGIKPDAEVQDTVSGILQAADSIPQAEVDSACAAALAAVDPYLDEVHGAIGLVQPIADEVQDCAGFITGLVKPVAEQDQIAPEDVTDLVEPIMGQVQNSTNAIINLIKPFLKFN